MSQDQVAVLPLGAQSVKVCEFELTGSPFVSIVFLHFVELFPYHRKTSTVFLPVDNIPTRDRLNRRGIVPNPINID